MVLLDYPCVCVRVYLFACALTKLLRLLLFHHALTLLFDACILFLLPPPHPLDWVFADFKTVVDH
eukprot:m.237828 g.237828  ORF g.237828 m.237828 type:complete len:65 (-) comp21421_c0_seq1:10-204(-)